MGKGHDTRKVERDYTAFLDTSHYGLGILTALNSTHLEWGFYNSQDQQLLDAITIVRTRVQDTQRIQIKATHLSASNLTMVGMSMLFLLVLGVGLYFYRRRPVFCKPLADLEEIRPRGYSIANMRTDHATDAGLDSGVLRSRLL